MTEPLPKATGDVVDGAYRPLELRLLQRERGERGELCPQRLDKCLAVLDVVAVVEGEGSPRIGVVHLIVV